MCVYEKICALVKKMFPREKNYFFAKKKMLPVEKFPPLWKKKYFLETKNWFLREKIKPEKGKLWITNRVSAKRLSESSSRLQTNKEMPRRFAKDLRDWQPWNFSLQRSELIRSTVGTAVTNEKKKSSIILYELFFVIKV